MLQLSWDKIKALHFAEKRKIFPQKNPHSAVMKKFPSSFHFCYSFLHFVCDLTFWDEKKNQYTQNPWLTESLTGTGPCLNIFLKWLAWHSISLRISNGSFCLKLGQAVSSKELWLSKWLPPFLFSLNLSADLIHGFVMPFLSPHPKKWISTCDVLHCLCSENNWEFLQLSFYSHRTGIHPWNRWLLSQ